MDYRSLYGLASAQHHFIAGWETHCSSHGSNASLKGDFLNSDINLSPYYIFSKLSDPFPFSALLIVCKKERYVKSLVTGTTWTLTNQNGHQSTEGRAMPVSVIWGSSLCVCVSCLCVCVFHEGCDCACGAIYSVPVKQPALNKYLLSGKGVPITIILEAFGLGE